ncbi:choice-of-anchor Q domain-containing protein, partial [Persicitalea sp.]|uniref:T9SS type A sorting domain-containing protein n=1 Tax=Persicitalea sp. TaxID=3100273 RepID=UPI00359324CA
YLFLLLAILALPASATVRYVDANRPDNAGNGLTWATAHKHLQSALAAATDGDQIWVAKGTYKPTTDPNDRDASFVMKEGVAIYGGFTSGQMNVNDRNTDPASNGTVLSGDIDGSETAVNNSNHIIFNVNNALTVRAVLDGFTVQGGNDYNYGSNGTQSEGSAMYNEASSPAINRCSFLFNNSTGAGGAIYNKNSSPRISNCSFRGNVTGSVGGAIYNIGGGPSITNCQFQYNVSSSFDGGAIYLSNTDLSTEIKDCEFEGNQSFYNGGAIDKDGGSLDLMNCVFRTNSTRFRSTGGGGVRNRGSIRIENCQFIKNSSQNGGALANSSGGDDCQIINSTFTENNAFRGGAISSSGSPQLRNCLFQKNGALSGGAMYNNGSPTAYGENVPQLMNCSFLENSASDSHNSSENGGGAIYNFGKGSPQLTNCVLWNNGGANTFNDGGLNSVVPTVAYTVLDASVTRFGGIGPITYIQVNQSPFVSDTDARLRPGSPAIDAGLNSANTTTTDLAGNQRIINGTIDMGACEFSNPSDFAITGVSGVNCQEISPTARQLTFTPVYKNTDGSPITFSVFGELADTQAPGPYSLRLYKDNPVITLIAKQGNGQQFRFQYDWLAACGTTPPPPPPPSTGDFAITGISGANCQELSPTARQLTFTPTYQGNDGSPITFSIFGELADTQAPGPYSIRLYIDNPSITLFAKQGNRERVSFEYDWLATCGTTPPPPPPTTGKFAITGVSGVNCQVLSPTARQLTFTPTYQGSNGSPINFSIFGELADTNAPGPYSIRLYIDNPSITLFAIQSGMSERAQFEYNWLNVCNAAAARLGVAEEPGSALRLTVLGNPVVDGIVNLEVRGAKGQPLTIQLTDLNGRLVDERRVEQAESVESHSLKIGQQAAGVLLLRANTLNTSQTVKVLNVR